MPVELVSKVLSKVLPEKRMARLVKIGEEHGDVFGAQDEVCGCVLHLGRCMRVRVRMCMSARMFPCERV